ncbi:MAG: hypothetical protein ACI8XM_002558 [Haloarculaceae archaeon]|jgi:hypothetical protein
MSRQQPLRTPESQAFTAEEATERQISAESLLLRNYDREKPHRLAVTCVGPSGEIAFDRTVLVEPMETLSIETRLERSVYDVEVRLDGHTTASAECLIGSDPAECAVIETGNNTVSVTDGHF